MRRREYRHLERIRNRRFIQLGQMLAGFTVRRIDAQNLVQDVALFKRVSDYFADQDQDIGIGFVERVSLLREYACARRIAVGEQTIGAVKQFTNGVVGRHSILLFCYTSGVLRMSRALRVAAPYRMASVQGMRMGQHYGKIAH